MIYKGLLTERMPLISALEKETGFAAEYKGAPGFKYIIGPHTVLRDGSLETEDAELASRLASQGLIEGTEDLTGIYFSLDGFSGRSLVNIINIFASKGKLINKSIGHPNSFHMDTDLVRKLKKENPYSVTDFMEVLRTCGGENGMKGVRITGSKIAFPGFQDTPINRILAEKIIESALTHRWINPFSKETQNEKYSFRVWLNFLGMKGPEYKTIRKELLEAFDGDSAFRTQEQKDAFYAKRKKAVEEPDFVLL